MTSTEQTTMNQNEEIYLATYKFESNDDLLKSVQAFYYAKGYRLSIHDLKKDQYVTLQCDLSGMYQDKQRAGTKRKKSHGSRLTGCPFQITEASMIDSFALEMLPDLDLDAEFFVLV
ncbi:hypothetical protein Tco_1146745 [Tanacetum coccineum]